jgi:hypothetical protein
VEFVSECSRALRTQLAKREILLHYSSMYIPSPSAFMDSHFQGTVLKPPPMQLLLYVKFMASKFHKSILLI